MPVNGSPASEMWISSKMLGKIRSQMMFLMG